MIALRSASPGRVPRPVVAATSPGAARKRSVPMVLDTDNSSIWSMPWRLVRWMYRGYTTVNASDMAAAVAFNTLVALVPMLLLAVAISGLFLKNDQVLEQARLAIERLVPGETTDEAFTAALTARKNSGWIGVVSFLGLAWVGTGFVSCLARSMNKIYGARNSGYINEKQRGFIVLMIFSFLFIISAVASILPTFFVNQNLPDVFDKWILASGQYQLIGYGIGLFTSILLFLTLYRIIPNAGQHVLDVLPGTFTSALLFLGITQAFPLYIRLTGGGNRYGQILGFVSLMVVSLLILAHIILFGAYVNASYQRRRRLRRRARLERDGLDGRVADGDAGFDFSPD
jgi:membrane protein